MIPGCERSRVRFPDKPLFLNLWFHSILNSISNNIVSSRSLVLYCIVSFLVFRSSHFSEHFFMLMEELEQL